MSYILEALKKADADRERERSRVPDLHARPDSLGDRERLHDRLRSRRGRWIGAALLALLGAAVTGWALWLPAVPPPPTSPTAPDRVSAPTPNALPRDPAASEAQAGPQAALTPTVIAVQIAPPVTPRVIAEAVRPPVASLVASPAGIAPAVALPSALPSASAGAARLPTLAELPADIRSQLPVLSVGGSMYSSNPAVRMVIVSGQVLREGDSPAAGLTVVQIGPKSTVLAFRGQRFELKH